MTTNRQARRQALENRIAAINTQDECRKAWLLASIEHDRKASIGMFTQYECNRSWYLAERDTWLAGRA